MIMAGDSESMDKNKHDSPFFAALNSDWRQRVVLPEPAVPATSIADGLINPPCNISSSPFIYVDFFI